jgi:DNA-binding MarR family transcriptional regulator
MHFPSCMNEERVEAMQARMRRYLRDLSGLDDTSGIELLTMLHKVVHLCDAIENKELSKSGLSGPRWAVLLRLMAEEQLDKSDGITPTSLSHFQCVSKNTISALLRGLEEQGLIQRTLDPADYRLFRIQLTSAGRELVQATAPQRIAYLNQMISGLSGAERDQLSTLLAKLQRSVLVQSNLCK